MALTPWTIAEGSPTPEDWKRCAKQSLRDAQRLAETGGYQNAYMLAGLAVEMALKGCIMSAERMNAWPDRTNRPEVFTHNLAALMEIARLRPALEAEVSDLSAVGIAWLVVKDFNVNSRYPSGKPFPERYTRDALDALKSKGLLSWLIQRIR